VYSSHLGIYPGVYSSHLGIYPGVESYTEGYSRVLRVIRKVIPVRVNVSNTASLPVCEVNVVIPASCFPLVIPVSLLVDVDHTVAHPARHCSYTRPRAHGPHILQHS